MIYGIALGFFLSAIPFFHELPPFSYFLGLLVLVLAFAHSLSQAK